jgi:hypothetical protein
MKKVAILFLHVLMLAGCKKDLTSINADPKNPLAVPSYSLFTNAQRNLSNTLTSTNVNMNIFRLIDQYWEQTTYTDESNYDLVTRQIPDRLWAAMYRDVLRDFKEAKILIPTDVSDAVIQKNEIAITDIMEVYTWYYTVATWGNIPYTEALDVTNKFPKYDDQVAIYNDLLKRIDADIAALTATGKSFGNADLIYQGDVAKWKKLAASFKLKM